MELNVGKCEMAHFGMKNDKDRYLNGNSLQSSGVQRELDLPVQRMSK